MFGSEVLEVAMGLAFVYLLLSLICSVLNEWVAGVFSMRASNLETGIRNLLKDAKDASKTDLADGVYANGLVKGLFKQDMLDKIFGRAGMPSYIPSRTFALALLDTIAPASASNPQTIDDLRQAIGKLPDSKARNALLALISDAQNDIQKARQNIENWFNDAMDRVSGWYKRKCQIIIFVFAIVISATFNADSVVIVNSLLRDPALRASVLTAAQEYVKSNQATSGNTNSTLPLEKVKELGAKLEPLHLPIGWVRDDPNDPRRVPSNGMAWLTKVVGLLLTVVALSLGAPFWFDLLNKIIVVRSTIKPREKSPAEASKDKN